MGQLAIVAVLLVAFGLRVGRLDHQELRGDEAFGYFFSLPSLARIVQDTLVLQEPHPVASYFLQHGWLALAGNNEFALRFLSAWFGVLAVALIYRLGRQLGLGVWTSALAAGLLAVSPYAIWHSQDARMYSMSLALTLAAVNAALAALRRPRWPVWLLSVALAWLALHTHYFAAFVLLALNLFVLGLVLMRDIRRPVALQWLASQVVLGLAYLPWLLAAQNTLSAYRGNGDSPDLAAMLQRALAVFTVGESIPAALRTELALLGGALLILGVLRLARSGPRGRQALLLLSLYLGVPLLVTWGSSWQRPIFNERYLVAAAPPFYLLAAIAVLGVSRPASQLFGRRSARSDRLLGWLGVGLLALLLFSVYGALGRYYIDPAYSKSRGWRELATALSRYSAGWPASDVRVAQNFPDPTLWYYYDGPLQHVVLPPSAHDRGGAERLVTLSAAEGVDRWIIPLQPAAWWDDAGIAQDALESVYDLALETTVGVWPLQVYQRPPQDVPAMDVEFADGIRLHGAAVVTPPSPAGDALMVYLRWADSAAALSGGEKLTLQVLKPDGSIAAQSDLPFGVADLTGSVRPYRVALPDDLPTGVYRLILALYDADQAGAPRLLTKAGADHVELATFDW